MDDTLFFKRRRLITDRLIPYGFLKTEDGFRYSAGILDNQFCLTVEISDEGYVNTQVADTESGEEYVLHRVPDAVGSFTGAVRNAYENVLLDIADKCFQPDIFKTIQAKAVIAYVQEAYGDELEFLWKKFPENAVWRRKDTGKWYGALLTVSKQKLGLQSDELAEIIDLRILPDELESLLDGAAYLPGYHMNKKNWYTMILDGSVATDEICRRIDSSYKLAVK